MSAVRSCCALLVASALAACAASPARAPTSPVASTVVPAEGATGADDNLNAVAWTQTAIEHDLVYREVYRAAGAQLLRALADPGWDALPEQERRNPYAGLKPAVILDVDETVLDNSPYQARLVRDARRYDEFSWSQWCREKAARALPGAVEFTRLAAQHGVDVFYLSNRAQDLDTVTLANLREAGFPVASDASFLGLGTLVPGCEQVGSEKGCRRSLVGQKHRVLLQFGDQIGDFVDVLANTPHGRRDALAPHAAWIGERWFVFPNATYGSWEPALFNNDWSQPVERQRAAKKSQLSY